AGKSVLVAWAQPGDERDRRVRRGEQTRRMGLQDGDWVVVGQFRRASMATSSAASCGVIHGSNVTPHGHATRAGSRSGSALRSWPPACRAGRCSISPLIRSLISVSTRVKSLATLLLHQRHMALTLLAFQSLLVNEDRVYRARACGREQDDGTWEGW